MVQTAHSLADFIAAFPDTFKQWKQESNSIISLGIPNEQSLIKLYEKFKKLGYQVVLFYEPDIDANTSLCLYATPDIRKKVSYLPLILKKKKEIEVAQS